MKTLATLASILLISVFLFGAFELYAALSNKTVAACIGVVIVFIPFCLIIEIAAWVMKNNENN